MKLETFFEKFEQFADAPNAVAKMRELVLSQAMRGHLSQQQPEDVVLNVTAIRDSKIAYEIPNKWSWVRLGEISELITSGSRDWSQYYAETGAVFLTMGNLSRGTYQLRLDRLRYVNPPKSGEGTRTKLQSQDILVSITGEVGNLGLIPNNFEEAYINQHSCLLRLKADFRTRFIAEFLRSPHAKLQFDEPQRGIKNSFRLSDVAEIEVPLPPLAEQKRIVAKVDELMALCDRLEAQQQERETRHAALARASLARFADAPTPANLPFLFHSSFNISPSDLRKSILTLAVQGKLVPQDPNDEPANITFPKLAGASVETDEDEFPAHWLRVPLGIIGEWRGGGTPSKSRPEFWKGDLPWVSPKDMKVFYISDAQDHISKAAVEGSSVRLIPPGSLLMVVRGMILARAFPVALTTQEVTINQDMKALLPSEPKIKNYLLLALRAFEPDVLAAIEHSSHGTCKLKTEFLHDFIMPIPPLAEQRRIVAKVDHLMAMVDQLEIQLTTARATAANLLDAIVAELTGTTRDPRSATRSSSSTPGTGRRGRPRKTA